MKGNYLIGFVTCGLLAVSPGFAADKAAAPASIGPCAPTMAGPDFVPGVDAMGQPVPRADIGATPVPLPGSVLVPLSGRGAAPGGRAREPAYAAIDGHKLEALLNTKACPIPGRN